MCRQKGNSHIKYLESTLFFLSTLDFCTFLGRSIAGTALRQPSFIFGSEFRLERCEEETGGILTVDCDFHSFGVGRSDVVQSAAFVVPGLVPRNASDVQMQATFVPPTWKQKGEQVQWRDSSYVAAG